MIGFCIIHCYFLISNLEVTLDKSENYTEERILCVNFIKFLSLKNGEFSESWSHSICQ